MAESGIAPEALAKLEIWWLFEPSGFKMLFDYMESEA